MCCGAALGCTVTSSRLPFDVIGLGVVLHGRAVMSGHSAKDIGIPRVLWNYGLSREGRLCRGLVPTRKNHPIWQVSLLPLAYLTV